MPRFDEQPVADAIDGVIAHIRALAGHPGLSRIDGKAVLGSLGPFLFLKFKHVADGRMLATPAGDREETSCPARHP